MGGSDQWGNIVNGIDLGRRMGTPQLYRADHAAAHDRVGREDGQDRAGRGLAQRRPVLSPYDFWQYWRNTEDADVAKFLKLFTILPIERDRAARGAAGAARSTRPRRCWRREATALLHGRDAANAAAGNRAADL